VKKESTRGGTSGGARGGHGNGRNAGRPKRKTADELDAEMTDYFGASQTNGEAGVAGSATASAGAAPANDDAGMGEVL